MDNQEMLATEHDDYLKIVQTLPLMMSSYRFPVLKSWIDDHELSFSAVGTVQIDNSYPISVTCVENIIYSCFAGYESKPKNLQEIDLEHMKALKDAIHSVKENLNDYVYKD